MKIQLSNKKIVQDAIVVWQEHGPEVDVAMDLKKLTFKPGSVDAIYSFHVLDHMFPEEAVEAIKNWRACLKPGGKIFIIVDDFEFVARGFIGGDISIQLLNELYAHPTQYTRELAIESLKAGGFSESNMNIWMADVVDETFNRSQVELVLESIKKHE
jgi:predicted SAM-dependent methyltransferase